MTIPDWYCESWPRGEVTPGTRPDCSHLCKRPYNHEGPCQCPCGATWNRRG